MLTRDGTAESVSRDQILRHERGQGNITFSCSANHVQDWQPYSVGPYSDICGTTHTYYIGPLKLIRQFRHLSSAAQSGVCMYTVAFKKKNQNAPRPSEHPPVRGEKCQNV